MSRVWILVTGVALLAIAIVSFVVPIFGGYPYPLLIELCASETDLERMAFLGEAIFGEGLEEALIEECKDVRTTTLVLTGLAITGIGLIIIGAVLPSKK